VEEKRAAAMARRWPVMSRTSSLSRSGSPFEPPTAEAAAGARNEVAEAGVAGSIGQADLGDSHEVLSQRLPV
jgi:hypothetical protein